jgi:hypothetical protein
MTIKKCLGKRKKKKEKRKKKKDESAPYPIQSTGTHPLCFSHSLDSHRTK